MAKSEDQKSDIGVIGLAVMGQNLILNLNDHGFKVTAFNRSTDKVDAFLANEAKGTNIQGAQSLDELVNSLKTPRKILLMVKAGEPVDQTIKSLVPLLDSHDIIIDGGNSNYQDTERRFEELAAQNIRYVGTGVSGGEEGARKGPSIMPGGDKKAWTELKPILQAVAAKTDQNEPCCEWVGSGGAGHYVKMIHNGIEYGDMQIIAEAYALLKNVLNIDNAELSEIFNSWNTSELNSYLIEITAEIFAHQQPNGKHTIDTILDAAGQKGTGKWTVIDAANLGQPVTLISEAVFARCLSSMVETRAQISKKLPSAANEISLDKQNFINEVKSAVYASKIISYTQGFMLMKAASDENNWNIDLASVALMWRGGCIIRSSFLGDINKAFASQTINNLIEDDFFASQLTNNETGWRQTIKTAVDAQIAIPAISSALAFYDGIRTKNSPANLIQAQRDFFGAHTYEQVDSPRGEFTHTNWTGEGGTVSSSAYQV